MQFDKLFVIDASYLDYFFYLVFCFERDQTPMNPDFFESSGEKIELDFSDINLLLNLDDSDECRIFPHIVDFEKFLIKMAPEILFSKNIRLYKYRNCCEFDKLNLKFTDIQSLNDPFEGECYWMSNSHDFYPYILSLCTKKDDLLMWSYYGGGHKGMCLKYMSSDINKALLRFVNEGDNFTNIVFAGRKKLSYNQKIEFKQSLNGGNLVETVYNLIRKCFLKNPRFRHENEFRYLIVSKNGNQNNFVECVPKEVEVGCYKPKMDFKVVSCNLNDLK